MFNNNDNHLLHRNAVKLVLENLEGSINMNDVYGFRKPYDVEWNNIKLMIKASNKTKKSSQNRSRWYYSLTEKDHDMADYFILFAIKDGKVGAVYAMPTVLSPKRFITITNLDGNVRYDLFKTDIQGLAGKIMKTEKQLPKLVKLYREADGLLNLNKNA